MWKCPTDRVVETHTDRAHSIKVGEVHPQTQQTRLLSSPTDFPRSQMHIDRSHFPNAHTLLCGICREIVSHGVCGRESGLCLNFVELELLIEHNKMKFKNFSKSHQNHKRPVRTLSIHHRLRNVQAGRSSSRPPPAISGERGRSIRAQDGESRLIVRGEGIVCIGKHRSKVRTIEQILFKYSRISRCLSRNHIGASRCARIRYGLNGSSLRLILSSYHFSFCVSETLHAPTQRNQALNGYFYISEPTSRKIRNSKLVQDEINAYRNPACCHFPHSFWSLNKHHSQHSFSQ